MIIRIRIFAVLAAAILSACSALPGAGPDLLTTASVDDGVSGPRVIDIDAHVIATLKSGTNPSLTSFSEYQPASAPVIGVGDIVRVNIWEAAPGNLFNASNTRIGVGRIRRRNSDPRSGRTARWNDQCSIRRRHQGDGQAAPGG